MKKKKDEGIRWRKEEKENEVKLRRMREKVEHLGVRKRQSKELEKQEGSEIKN
jgi:hypothetical protein